MIRCWFRDGFVRGSVGRSGCYFVDRPVFEMLAGHDPLAVVFSCGKVGLADQGGLDMFRREAKGFGDVGGSDY